MLPRYIGPVISPLERNKRRSHKVFGAYLAERIRLFREHGKEWEDKPVGPFQAILLPVPDISVPS